CPGFRRPSTIASLISSVAATLALRTRPSPLSNIPGTAAKIQYAIRPANPPPGGLPPARRDYGSRRMDRSAIVRAERRRQATDELEVERDRAVALREEITRLVVELEGPRLDEEVFAQLVAEDVELVRPALQGGPAIAGTEGEWLDADEPWQ